MARQVRLHSVKITMKRQKSTKIANLQAETKGINHKQELGLKKSPIEIGLRGYNPSPVEIG
jgi:hypothetical protein